MIDNNDPIKVTNRNLNVYKMTWGLTEFVFNFINPLLCKYLQTKDCFNEVMDVSTEQKVQVLMNITIKQVTECEKS